MSLEALFQTNTSMIRHYVKVAFRHILNSRTFSISVLSSIGGVEPMLQGHLNICLNVGLTPPQLKQFVNIIRSTAGEKEAVSAKSVLDEVLKNKGSQ